MDNEGSCFLKATPHLLGNIIQPPVCPDPGRQAASFYINFPSLTRRIPSTITMDTSDDLAE